MMARSIKGTDKTAIKAARKFEKTTRKIRKDISRANGR